MTVPQKFIDGQYRYFNPSQYSQRPSTVRFCEHRDGSVLLPDATDVYISDTGQTLADITGGSGSNNRTTLEVIAGAMPTTPTTTQATAGRTNGDIHQAHYDDGIAFFTLTLGAWVLTDTQETDGTDGKLLDGEYDATSGTLPAGNAGDWIEVGTTGNGWTESEWYQLNTASAGGTFAAENGNWTKIRDVPPGNGGYVDEGPLTVAGQQVTLTNTPATGAIVVGSTVGGGRAIQEGEHFTRSGLVLTMLPAANISDGERLYLQFRVNTVTSTPLTARGAVTLTTGTTSVDKDLNAFVKIDAGHASAVFTATGGTYPDITVKNDKTTNITFDGVQVLAKETQRIVDAGSGPEAF